MADMSSAKACRIALFMIWMIVLTPIYSASALQVNFNPDSGVQVTDNSFKISWSTDEPTTGEVVYGPQGDVNEKAKSQTTGTSHEISVTGIAPERTFLFYITAKNTTGESIRSPVDSGDYHSLTTEPPRDRTAPYPVKDLAPVNIDKTSVTFSWTPDERDTDISHYNIYRGSELIAADVMSTEYTDMGLDFLTAYEYKVSPVDLAGNNGSKTTLSITTRSENYQPIQLSDFTAEAFGTNIQVSWKTNAETHSRVKYSQNPLELDQQKEVPDLVTEHEMTLSDMPPNTQITLMAESCDTEGTCGSSEAVTVQTTQKIALSLSLDGMDCNPSTPTFANTNRIDVAGHSAPGANVELFVNGNRQRFKRITETGVFNFAGIDLMPNSAQNSIRVTASDGISANKECIENFALDYFAPEVHFDNETENLKIATQQSVQLRGNLTDENAVTLNVYLKSLDDIIPPPAPSNVTNTSLGPNSVTLNWGAYGDEVKDLYKYLVYRTDVLAGPIEVVEPNTRSFTDNNVSTSTTYTYQISAMDEAGNEGAKSAPFSITTMAGGSEMPLRGSIIPPNPSRLSTKEYQLTGNTIQFTETVGPLFEGRNVIRMEYVDIAGNVFEKNLELTMDTEPPRIISPTSAELAQIYSPSYTSEVLVTGQINKPVGEIWVYVNPSGTDFRVSADGMISEGSFFATTAPESKIEVGANGTFEVEIPLSTSIGAAIAGSFTGETAPGSTSGGAGISVSTGAGKKNKIVMVAVDSLGRVSEPVEATLEYNTCSEGHYWNVKLTHGGNVINTRELLEGVAAYGFGFELEWTGGGDPTKAKPVGIPKVTKATVGTLDNKKYDFGWIGTPLVTCNRLNCTKGFVQINFLPQDPVGETYLEKEQNLSNHRKDECKLSGCIHLLLQMEINSDPAPFRAQYASDPGATPVGMAAPGVQTQCIDMRISLDERIDFANNDFVRGLLNASLKAINVTLEFINMIEPVIKTVTQITLGLCMLSLVSKFVVDAIKSYNCKWSGAIAELTSGDLKGIIKGGAELVQARIEKTAMMYDGKEGGSCDMEFPTDTANDKENQANQKANSACKECAGWIDKSKWITDKWHLFCDRVMCPSVPSLQYFIKTKFGKTGKPIEAQTQGSSYTTVAKYNKGDWQKFQTRSTSDCAYAELSGNSIKTMYDFYSAEEGEEQKKCEEGHVPQAACCPFEYMDEWGWGMMFSNEVKQSYCLAHPEDKTNCGIGSSIINGVTGICQPNSETPRASPVVLDRLKWAKDQPKENKLDDSVVYMVNLDANGNPSSIRRGYYSREEVVDIDNEADELGRVKISTGAYFIRDPESDEMSEWFSQLDNQDISNDVDRFDEGLQKFGDDLMVQLTPPDARILPRTGDAGILLRGNNKGGYKGTQIEDWYRQITGLMGDPGRQYLAQPAGSFIQSVLTLCLSGILSWLIQFKNMLLMLQQCFQTILITGDGSAGQCRATISYYICDVLKEAISCFMTRFGSGGGGRVDVDAGIGGVFSAISDASTSMTEELQGRYGDKNMFSTVFSAENLMHDACIFMFTGEWPTDWSTLFDQAAYLPINSSGMVFPVTR
ncbi:MAG: fibronectin type III domain-containing protein, partial [Candidatus Woesearchaeota archaeon]